MKKTLQRAYALTRRQAASLPALFALIALLKVALLASLLSLTNEAQAVDGIDIGRWRKAVIEVRTLAENDALGAYREAKRLMVDIPGDAAVSDTVRINNLMARIESYLAHVNEAELHARQALEIARQHSDRIAQAEANLSLALIVIDKGLLSEEPGIVSDALSALEGTSRPDLLAEAMLRAVLMHRRLGQLEASMSMAMRAMEIAQRSTDPLVLAYAHQGLAVSHEISSRFPEAFDHYSQMRAYAQAAGNRRLLALALVGMAGTTPRLEDMEGAKSVLEQATDLFDSAGMPFNLNQARFGMADILRRQGHLPEAAGQLDEVVADYQRNPNPIGLWKTLVARCDILLALGRIKEALADARASEKLADDLAFPHYQSESAKRLAAIAAAQGEYERAYRHTLRATFLVDTAEQRNAAINIAQITEQFRTENKQRQIDELQRLEVQHSLEQRWLWTVVVSSLVLLIVIANFLLRQRISNRVLRALNIELQRSRNRLQATLEAIPDPMFELGLDGRYFNCHSPRSELLPAPPSDFVGSSVRDRLPAEAAEVSLAALREANETGTSTGRQYSLSLPKGTYWFELSVARKELSSGNNPRFIVLARDITARKQTEALLKRQLELEAQFRTLAENAPDHIARYDKNCRTIYVNARVEQVLGVDGRTLLGLTPSQILPGEAGVALEDSVRKAIETGKIAETQFSSPDTTGEWHHYQILSVAERSARNEIVGALAIGRDISVLRRYERQIEDSRDMLRQLAARMDSAREEERKRVAREIHDELGQMLTAQRLDIAMIKLQFGEADPVLAKRCDHLLEVADRTIKVVRNVAKALRPASLDMGTVSALEWLAKEFRARTGTVCHLHVADDIDLDDEQSIAIFRIVQESLTNVARYAAAHDVSVNLERHADRYELSVCDDGNGFDPDEPNTKTFGLLGIRERALIMGGKADIISTPGYGTTVRITIPCHRRGDTP